MKSVSKWAVIVLSVAGLGMYCSAPTIADSTSSSPSADSQQATGTITGTVTKDGKPLANARVALIVKVRHGKKAGKNSEASNNESASTQPSGTAEKHHHPKPIATATTDADGKFTLNDVNVGDYVVIAGLRGQGRGHEHVAVTAGQTASVEIPVNVPGDKTGNHNKQAQKLGI